MMCLSGWQSVDLNFFKMFRSCLINRFLIETGNEMNFKLIVPFFFCKNEDFKMISAQHSIMAKINLPKNLLAW